jgi:hypothetical protein
MADALGARPRPPMPPVPPPAAPRPTAASFTPAPEREALRPSATVLDERPPAASVLRDIPSPAGPPLLSQPVPDLPARPLSDWPDGEHQAPWQTGRGEIRADRSPAARPESVPFVERRASRLPSAALRPSAGQGEMPAYGDWTKPSGPGRLASAPVPPLPVVPPAPLTSAIPDRDLSGRPESDLDDGRYVDERPEAGLREGRYDDEYDADYDDAPRIDRDADRQERVEAMSGPVTGTVVGGRAALRAEREAREASRVAAEAARRKRAGLDDLDERPRRPRRMLKGLVAVAAVAAAVMGVYTVATPDTAETSASTPAAPTTAPTTAPTSAAEVTQTLAPLDVDPSVTAEATPAAPVRVPVTVLNSTDIDGLAADISAQIKGEGWKTAEPGGYPNEDVAASTVFFTEGDEKQRQAALQLIEQFPQLQGPTPRFFEVPSEVDAPGLVIVAAGDWKP